MKSFLLSLALMLALAGFFAGSDLWMNDFSWNVVDGSNNNFGMARSGITFAF